MTILCVLCFKIKAPLNITGRYISSTWSIILQYFNLPIPEGFLIQVAQIQIHKPAMMLRSAVQPFYKSLLPILNGWVEFSLVIFVFGKFHTKKTCLALTLLFFGASVLVCFQIQWIQWSLLWYASMHRTALWRVMPGFIQVLSFSRVLSDYVWLATLYCCYATCSMRFPPIHTKRGCKNIGNDVDCNKTILVFKTEKWSLEEWYFSN